MVEKILSFFFTTFVSFVKGLLCTLPAPAKQTSKTSHYSAVKARLLFFSTPPSPTGQFNPLEIKGWRKKIFVHCKVKWRHRKKKSLSVHIKLAMGVRKMIRQERKMLELLYSALLFSPWQLKCQSEGISRGFFSSPQSPWQWNELRRTQ